MIALVIFGPNGLPKIASQVGLALRDLHTIADGAKNDLREGLGPELADFETEDLDPKRFVHSTSSATRSRTSQPSLIHSEQPPLTPATARRSTRTRREPSVSQ